MVPLHSARSKRWCKQEAGGGCVQQRKSNVGGATGLIPDHNLRDGIVQAQFAVQPKMMPSSVEKIKLGVEPFVNKNPVEPLVVTDPKGRPCMVG